MSAKVFAQYQPGPGSGRTSDQVVVVRVGVMRDVPGCVDLVEGVLGLERAPWERRLTESVTDSQHVLHVAEDGGRIVGYARARHWTPSVDAPPNAAPRGWYLVGLVVTPEYRRCGIGRALTVARMAAIAERASTVWYFVNAENRASLDLHAKLGFAEVTRDFWFPGLTFDGGEGILARANTRAAR